MILKTTRFGEVEVDENRIITFPNGLLGFPKYTQYVLIQPSEDSLFYWMQSIQAEDLAFIVTDPSLFVSSYKVPLKQDQMDGLGIRTMEDAQVFVIVNKRDNMLTGNLQGPLVVHVDQLIGAQLVLSDRRFTTRVPLVELDANVEAVSA